MNINIYAKNMALTEAIRDYVEEKLGLVSKMLSAKDYELARYRVEVGKSSKRHHSGPFFRAEINLSFGSLLLRAESNHEDLYAAINEARDELERQIRKRHTKVKAVRRKKIRRVKP